MFTLIIERAGWQCVVWTTRMSGLTRESLKKTYGLVEQRTDGSCKSDDMTAGRETLLPVKS